MKMFITSLFCFILSGSLLANDYDDWRAVSGWKDIEIYAAANGGTEKDLKGVTPNTIGAYWAGRLTEFYWDRSQDAVTKVRVRVTWSSDRGEPCGKVVELPIDGFKDFDYRSIAMKKCG